jgi:HSP20 family protein
MKKKNKANKEKVKKEGEEKSWFKREGELAVDIYETEKNIVIQAPIAGVKREDIEVVTEKDTVIIKGSRACPRTEEEVKSFYTQECFFGNFRREIIMPEDFDPSHIKADLKEGVLIVEVPKIEREKQRKIKI